jgi:hypothetical protein
MRIFPIERLVPLGMLVVGYLRFTSSMYFFRSRKIARYNLNPLQATRGATQHQRIIDLNAITQKRMKNQATKPIMIGG